MTNTHFRIIADWMFQWSKDTPPINTPVADIKSLYDQDPEVFANDLNMVLWEMSRSFQYIIDIALPALKKEGVDIGKISALPFLIEAMKNSNNKEFFKSEGIDYVSIFNSMQEPAYDASKILRLDLSVIQQLVKEGLDFKSIVLKQPYDANYYLEIAIVNALYHYSETGESLDCKNDNIKHILFLNENGLGASFEEDLTLNCSILSQYKSNKCEKDIASHIEGGIYPSNLNAELYEQYKIIESCLSGATAEEVHDL